MPEWALNSSARQLELESQLELEWQLELESQLELELESQLALAHSPSLKAQRSQLTQLRPTCHLQE
jgi:hypothetical protein